MNIIIILICFALVLLLSRLRLPLGLCLLVGAVVLGLWSGLPPLELVRSVIYSVRQWDTLYLILIIILILLVSRLMERSGHLRRIVYAFVLVVKDRRAVCALIPALIGVLPMPGGALFSAPLVKSAVKERSLSGEEKTVINYWFRHVWEYWWPLYPGFILAVGLLGVAAWKIMLIQLPLALFCVISGIVFLLLPLKNFQKREGPPLSGESISTLIKEVMPLILVVAIIAGFALIRRLLGWAGVELNFPTGTPVLLGLVACILWVVGINRLSFKDVVKGLSNWNYLSFSFLVVAVMIFKGVLNDSGIVLSIKNELVTYHIPPLLIIVLLPFISGLVTGIAIGFVGASFPVILPLISGLPPLSYLAHACLAYGFGYMGMMLSPVHLCFLFSRDYFQAGFHSCYRILLKPVALVLVLSCLYFLLLTRL